MRYPDIVREHYRDQLRGWIKKTGKTQRQLAKLTANFPSLTKNGKPLSDDVFTRTISDIPARGARIESLCAILGVMYLLKIVDKTDLDEFIKKYDIPLTETGWNKIWLIIEAGTQQAQNQQEDPQSTQSSSIANGQLPSLFTRRLKWLPLVIGGIVFVGIALVILALFSQANSSNLSNYTISVVPPCAASFVRADPPFLPDQGFSQYRVDIAQIIGASILSNHTRSLGVSEHGLWVGYMPIVGSTDRVSLFDKANWLHYCTGTPLAPQQNVNDIAFFNDLIFIATDGAGIGQFDGESWRFYTQKDGLPSNSVYSLTVDENELWASTYEGVARLANEQWQVVYQASATPLTSNHVFAFLPDAQGNRWFGLIDSGISRLDATGQWYAYFSTDLNLRNIRDIHTDNEGAIWFATDRGGVLRFQDENWTIFNVAQQQLPSDTIRDIERDHFGRMWVATARGVAYTRDFGQTWITHSTMDTFDIEFGCMGCPFFDEQHMLLALKEAGIGHIRIPPESPTIEFVSVPTRIQLQPGETYIFEVEVQVLSGDLTASRGDSLRSNEPLDTFLHGAYPIIPLTAEVSEGETYIFTNENNPIIAPEKAGIYTQRWRVFQGGRFVTEPITIEFEVIEN